MKQADISLLFQYNYWATQQILEQAKNVSIEDLFKSRGYSWDSLGGTLIHIMDAEYGWRRLLENGASSPLLTVDDFDDIDAIITRWHQEETEMWTYLKSLSDEDMTSTLSYAVEDGTRERVLWHCLLHVVNHGTQHRSECAVMLTELGQSPGEIDFTVFTLTL